MRRRYARTLTAAIALAIGATITISAPTAAQAGPALVGPQLIQDSSCPEGYRSVVPDAASLLANGVDAFVSPGASDAERRSVENDPLIQRAVTHHAQWIAAKCAVTNVTAGPAAGAGSALSNGSQTTSNWSGWQYSGVAPGYSYYDYVAMRWTVPSAEFGVLTTQRDVSIWPGLGTGSSANDVLVQAGTQTTSGPAGVQATYPWTEIYPVQPTEVQITNLPAPAGAVISSLVWVTQMYHAQANVQFSMCNETHWKCVLINETVPTGGTFTGQTAEFIVERPGIAGGFSELDNFNYVQVQYAHATAHSASAATSSPPIWATNASWAGETTNKITMKSCNGGTLLAEPSNVPSGSPTGNFIVLWHNHGQLESC